MVVVKLTPEGFKSYPSEEAAQREATEQFFERLRPSRRRRGVGGVGDGGRAARAAEAARVAEAARAREELRKLTEAREKEKTRKIAGVITERQRIRMAELKRPVKPTGVVRPFVDPPLQEKLRIRLASGLKTIINKGIELKKNKDEIDAEIRDFFIRAGLTDKKVKEIQKFVGDPLTDLLSKKKGRVGQGALKIQQAEEALFGGAIKGVRDKPTTAALTLGVGRAAPQLIKFVGKTKIAKNILKGTPSKVKVGAAKTIPKALIASYLAASGLDVAKQPKGKRIERIGGILATEVGPFEIGARAGVRGVLRQEVLAELNAEIKKLPKAKQLAFKELVDKSDLLAKTKTTVRDIDLRRLKRIPTKAKQPIINFLKNKDIIVGGSLGQQTAVRIKRPLAQSDLDLYLEGDPVKAARDLKRTLQKKGIKRVSQVKGQVTIAGKKAAEFHNIDRLLANIESVVPAWRSPKSFITRTPGGIRVPKITVQLKRKLVGGFTDPKRAKDLKDARDILNQLLKRAELQARGKFLFREKNIKALEKAFGVKMSRKPLPTKPGKNLAKELTDRFIKGKAVKIKIPRKIKIDKVKKIPLKPTTKKPPKKPRETIPSQKPKPSQKPRPSQPPRKIPGRPSQPPRRPPRKPPPIKTPPPPTREPPSQPPRRPPRKPPPIRPPPTRIPPRRPPRKPPSKPPILPKRRRRLPIKKIQQSYNIFGKSGKKFFKLNKKPLNKKDALDRGAWAIDRTTSRTMKLIPAGRVKNLGTIKNKEKGHFQRNRSKLRNYRIVKGKRKLLGNKFIEFSKHAIDTKGEKNQLTLARLRRQQFGFGRAIKSKPVKRR